MKERFTFTVWQAYLKFLLVLILGIVFICNPSQALAFGFFNTAPEALDDCLTYRSALIADADGPFGPTGTEAKENYTKVKDVNKDGKPDLLLKFKTQETRITCDTSMVLLKGKTKDGQAILGSEIIQTADRPKNTPKKELL